MATEFNMTTMAAVLKERYTSYLLKEIYENRPLFGMIPKRTDWTGDNLKVPVQIGNASANSATFTTAQSNQYAAVYRAFTPSRVTMYQLARLDRQTMLATRNDEGAFFRAATRAMDDAVNGLVERLCGQMFRKTTGSIGQISGSVTSGVVYLADPESISNFNIGDVILAYQTDGGTAEAGTGYVLKVDRDPVTPSITVSATSVSGSAGTPSGWSDGDYLAPAGTVNLTMAGLSDYIPTTAPTSGDSFLGVDRSIDPVRLAGNRVNGTGMPLEEALNAIFTAVGKQGGRPDAFVTNYTTYNGLLNALGSRAVSVEMSGPAGISYSGVRYNAPTGPVKIWADPFCPGNIGYALQTNTWELASLDKAPHIVDDDGMGWFRVYNADASEVRVNFYGNMVCYAPGKNGVVQTAI